MLSIASEDAAREFVRSLFSYVAIAFLVLTVGVVLVNVVQQYSFFKLMLGIIAGFVLFLGLFVAGLTPLLALSIAGGLTVLVGLFSVIGDIL